MEEKKWVWKTLDTARKERRGEGAFALSDSAKDDRTAPRPTVEHKEVTAYGQNHFN